MASKRRRQRRRAQSWGVPSSFDVIERPSPHRVPKLSGFERTGPLATARLTPQASRLGKLSHKPSGGVVRPSRSQTVSGLSRLPVVGPILSHLAPKASKLTSARLTCKERPEYIKRGGGSGARFRLPSFKPWCKRK